MESNSLEDSVKDLKEYQESIKEAAESSEDVKNGKCTVDDELHEPAYVLFNNIAESSIRILQIPEVVNSFKKLSETLGEDGSKTLVELLALTMTQSAHQAVLFYDDLLKSELTKQFDIYGNQLNQMMADIKGQSAAMSVFRKRLDTIEKDTKIKDFSQKNNITPDPSK